MYLRFKCKKKLYHKGTRRKYRRIYYFEGWLSKTQNPEAKNRGRDKNLLHKIETSTEKKKKIIKPKDKGQMGKISYQNSYNKELNY